MKMKWLKRGLLLAVLTALLAAFSITAGASEQIPTDSFAFKAIDYTYPDGASKGTLKSGIVYNDGMLLGNANVLSGDVAKLSVALSAAAYDQGGVNNLLDAMGFTPYDNSAVYARESKYTISDNDYVAYTIAKKSLNYDGKSYLVYCVAVRGTGANAEWYSNFNIGDDATHEGFQRAAKEVQDQLVACINAETAEEQSATRILWFTGHSRGAAVANLLSAHFTLDGTYASSDRIFGYTFACPAVSHTADQSLTNIYNFNNAGDLVTMVPLTKWGYKRNGQDISLDGQVPEDLLLIDNLRQQYQRVFGSTFSSATTSADIGSMLNKLISDETVGNGERLDDTLQLTLNLAAFAMGGNKTTTLVDVVAHSGFESMSAAFQNINTLDQAVLKVTETEYTTLLDFCEETIPALDAGTTTLEVLKKDADTAEKLEALKEVLGEVIDDSSDLSKAKTAVSILCEGVKLVEKIGVESASLLYDTSGKPLSAVVQGHTQATYVMWINAAYYGYQGWAYNTSIQAAIIKDPCTNIGAMCFWNCSSLATLEIANTVRYLGKQSFYDCDSLTTVTLPVDYNIDTHPFISCGPVNTICYTPGKTGVMPDRSDDKDFANYYGNSLEYVALSTLTTVEFAEGITHIADYAFYNQSVSSGQLTSVKLSSTLTSIGTGAFFEQTELKTIDLPAGLTALGEKCFMNSTGLTSIVIPDNITEIPSYCFYGCTGLTKFVIPDSVTSLGSNAFVNCTNLKEITLPVDYSFSQKPFTGIRVHTIHYTPGETGKMPDRTDDNYANDYGYSLEGYGQTTLKSVDFAEGITAIGNYAFYGSTALAEISLPTTLKTIGNYTFANTTALSSVTLPDGVTALGEKCFMNSTGLTSIILPSSITKIPVRCFYGCTKLAALVIPKGVTHLGQEAFAEMTSLTEIVIPTSMKTIEKMAFYRSSKLAYAYYCGTEAQWNNVSVGANNEYLTKVLTFHKWQDGTEPPTCTAPGVEKYCVLCKAEVSVNALGHQYGEPVWTWAEDYASAEVVFTCSICGDIQKITAAVSGSKTDATCTQDGSGSFSGTVTFDKKTYLDTQSPIFPSSGHQYSAVVTSPTCTTEGYTTYTCPVCGGSYTGDKTPTGTHSYSSAVTAPTCTSGGYTTYTCSGCGDSYTGDKTPAGTHSYSSVVTAPTCTSGGYTTYTCSGCGDSYTGNATAALGHSWDSGVITTQPSTSLEGVRTYTCTACAATTTDTISKRQNPFVDVAEDASNWYLNPVLWAVDRSITTGTSATTFSPDNDCTRGQVVTFLWRAAGSPEPASSVNPFVDVPTGEYYYKAVLWALDNGITTGTSATTFSPDDSCTRGQVVTFLWRLAGKPGVSSGVAFTDTPGSAYYYSAVLWAVDQGITNGMGNGRFAPDDTCTRAHVVTFLYRYYT